MLVSLGLSHRPVSSVDWIEFMCAPQSESDTSASPDAPPVGWRWAPPPDRPHLPETAAAVAMLRNLGMRVQ